jgi:hypothetical protein
LENRRCFVTIIHNEDSDCEDGVYNRFYDPTFLLNLFSCGDLAMHVTIERSGGFIGAPMMRELDTAKVSHQQAIELETLLGAADFFNLQDALTQEPDRFQYSIKVDNQGQSHEIHVTETQMSDNLYALMEKTLELSA